MTETMLRASAGRGWQAVLAGGLAVLTAASITAVVGVSDPADADTFLTAVTDSVVALADGTEREARIGDRVPRGARLRTGAAGGARLTTDGRDVLVGALSTVLVRDGVRETLERGQVMVDSRSGPRLELAAQGGSVTTKAGSLARVERGVVLRVGVFDGSADVRVTGRQAVTTVPELYQVTSQYGALPGRPTALALTNDAWERRLAANLTGADEQLTRLQVGLEGPEGSLVLVATPVALRSVCAGTGRGEQALSVAVATVASNGSPAQTNADTVCTSRREGGSWGVVAAIVRASADDVSGQLEGELGPGTPTFLAGPEAPGSGLVPAGPTDGSTPSPGDPTSSPRPTPTRPTVSPTSPAPSPSGLVDEVITTIRDLVPVPLPSTSPLPLPLPTPTPLVPVPVG